MNAATNAVAATAPHNPWPAPDMSIQQESKSAPSMPLDVFGPNWGPVIFEEAQGLSAPPDYIAGPLLVAASACLGNSRAARDGEWTELGTIWAVSVGRPSNGKSPAADYARNLLGTLEAEEQPRFDNARRAWKRDAHAAEEIERVWKSEVAEALKKKKPPPDRPVGADKPPKVEPPCIVAQGITTYRLIEMASTNHHGFGCWFDELVVWLGAFDRNGGKGNGEDRAQWLNAYGGRPARLDRRQNDGEVIFAQRVATPIFGCIQPDRLKQHILQTEDDGLAARFTYWYPEPVDLVRRPATSVATWPLDALRRLRGLEMTYDGQGRPQPKPLPLTPPASDALFEFRRKAIVWGNESSGMLEGWIGKAPGLAMRLALVLELLWWSAKPAEAEPTVISEQAFGAATQLIESYLMPQAERVFGGISGDQSDQLATAIARYIMRHKAQTLNARWLDRQSGIPGAKDKALRLAALEKLEEYGWITPEKPGTTLGRPKSDYKINPRLYEATI